VIPNSSRVLYILVCGSPMARDVGKLVGFAQDEGWEVCVITTPDGRNFVDVNALHRQTGHAVRTWYKKPGEPDQLPPADAMIVAPATVNTVNKWAAGITDTLVLGLLVEGYGFETPTAVIPYTNNVMARHPVLHESLARLRGWGVHVLYDARRLGEPGQTDHFRRQFPWRRALQVVSDKLASKSMLEPGTF
jgi:phosphopantothenoylcysteine synthetase/decarboxylase